MKTLKITLIALALTAGVSTGAYAENLETMTLDEIVTWIDQNLSTPG